MEKVHKHKNELFGLKVRLINLSFDLISEQIEENFGDFCLELKEKALKQKIGHFLFHFIKKVAETIFKSQSELNLKTGAIDDCLGLLDHILDLLNNDLREFELNENFIRITLHRNANLLDHFSQRIAFLD